MDDALVITTEISKTPIAFEDLNKCLYGPLIICVKL